MDEPLLIKDDIATQKLTAKTEVGPMASIVVVVILIVIGGIYFFIHQAEKLRQVPPGQVSASS